MTLQLLRQHTRVLTHESLFVCNPPGASPYASKTAALPTLICPTWHKKCAEARRSAETSSRRALKCYARFSKLVFKFILFFQLIVLNNLMLEYKRWSKRPQVCWICSRTWSWRSRKASRSWRWTSSPLWRLGWWSCVSLSLPLSKRINYLWIR